MTNSATAEPDASRQRSKTRDPLNGLLENAAEGGAGKSPDDDDETGHCGSRVIDMQAAIYVRQSLDRDGKGAAVDRQLLACRKLCKEMGWTVSKVFEDNDISATSGKRRPAFEALLSSKPERIVVWHVDRLVRLSRELERVIDLGVNVHAVKSGHIDLSNPAGRAVAKTVTAWAQYEGEQKSTRQIAANQQRAAAGVWQFSNRPYGYERKNGKVEIVESEAAVLREAFTRYLAGETYYSIVENFNIRKIPTLKGGDWTITQLRERLSNPAYAGIRLYKGEHAATGDWEPIIPMETWESFAGMKLRRKTPHTWSNRTKYLLSGIALCGVCGSRMMARPDYPRPKDGVKQPAKIAYACTANWCVQRNLERVDEIVEGAVFIRLGQPDAVQLLMPKTDVTPFMRESDELRQRKDDLAIALSEGILTLAAVRAESLKLTTRLDALQKQIAAADGQSNLSELVQSSDIEDTWRNRTSFAQRRAAIELLMTVTINKQKNTRVFDPNDLVIKWRG